MLETMLRYDTATEKKTVDGVLSGLAPKKQLAYHLIQAANAGRTLLFQRTDRHSLAILLATTHRVTGAVLT